jgi:hypothetical protein
MEINIKLHLQELVRGMEERAAAQSESASSRRAISIRGLDLEAQVNFTNAMRGEVTITDPFNKTIRLNARVRTVAVKGPEVEHPILKAQRWQRLLETGAAPTRSALAEREGLTPGAITRIMKLLDLAPEIQRALTLMKTSSEVWHFGYWPMGKIVHLPFAEQRTKFAIMVSEYETKRLHADPKRTTSLLSCGSISPRVAPHICIG